MKASTFCGVPKGRKRYGNGIGMGRATFPSVLRAPLVRWKETSIHSMVLFGGNVDWEEMEHVVEGKGGHPVACLGHRD